MTKGQAGIDLALLADAYRFRPLSEAARIRAENAARQALDPLLDIGSGTGTHAATWATLGRSAISLDISDAMTRRAARDGRFAVVQGNAESLPLASASVGLAYFHMSIHYGEWKASLSEAARVVRPGGRIEVWTFSPDAMGATSLGRWFPTVARIDTERFPDPDTLAAHLAPMVSEVTVGRVDEVIERTAAAWEQAVRERFVSTLQLLDDDEIERGIAAFRDRYADDDAAYRYVAPYTTVTCVV